MKKTSTAAFALLLAGLPVAYAATQSFQGTVSDSMCEKKHMMPGKSDAECIKECVKAGSAYVLVADHKVYALSAKPGVLAAFAGKRVKVDGELKQSAIAVSAIRETK